MKRSRRYVTIRIKPPGGTYQFALLACPALVAGPLSRMAEGTSAWDTLNRFSAAFLGPVLVSFENSCAVPLAEHKSYIDRYVQSPQPVIGIENSFVHWYASGEISDSGGIDSHTHDELDESHSPYTFSFSYKHFTTNDSLTEHTLYRYDPGSVFHDEVMDPPTCGPIHVSKELNGSMLGVLDVGLGSMSYNEWNPDGDPQYRLVASWDLEKLRIEGSRALVSVAYKIGQVAPDGSWEETEYSLEQSCYLLCTSKMATEPIEGSATLSALESIRGEVSYLLSSLAVHRTREDTTYSAIQQAADAFEASTANGLAFMRDLLALKELVEPVIKVLKNPKSLKNWSGLVLWWKYAISLSYDDLRKFFLAFRQIRKSAKTMEAYINYKNSMFSKYGSSGEEISLFRGDQEIATGKHKASARLTARLAEPYDKSYTAMLFAGLHEMDMCITLGNLWDMVPYSFVFDWFINVGTVLEQIDTHQRLGQYDIFCYLSSRRNYVDTLEGAFKNISCIGNIHLETYERRVSRDLPNPRLEFGGPAYDKHYWEGLLLIVQRFGK